MYHVTPLLLRTAFHYNDNSDLCLEVTSYITVQGDEVATRELRSHEHAMCAGFVVVCLCVDA